MKFTKGCFCGKQKVVDKSVHNVRHAFVTGRWFSAKKKALFPLFRQKNLVDTLPSFSLLRPRPKCILRAKCIFDLHRFHILLVNINTWHILLVPRPNCVLAKYTKLIQVTGLKRENDGTKILRTNYELHKKGTFPQISRKRHFSRFSAGGKPSFPKTVILMENIDLGGKL